MSAESGLLLQHQVSEASQSLSFLGPPGKGWDSANQEDFLAPPHWSQRRHPAADLAVGGVCYLTQIMSWLLKAAEADAVQLVGCERSCVGTRTRDF